MSQLVRSLLPFFASRSIATYRYTFGSAHAVLRLLARAVSTGAAAADKAPTMRNPVPIRFVVYKAA